MQAMDSYKLLISEFIDMLNNEQRLKIDENTSLEVQH